MDLFEPSDMGGGGGGGAMRIPYHNFVVIAPMIIDTGIKLDVFYTTVSCGITSIT